MKSIDEYRDEHIVQSHRPRCAPAGYMVDNMESTSKCTWGEG